MLFIKYYVISSILIGITLYDALNIMTDKIALMSGYTHKEKGISIKICLLVLIISVLPIIRWGVLYSAIFKNTKISVEVYRESREDNKYGKN